MAEKINERYFSNSREYDIKLRIGDIDFSNDLCKLQIISSINTPYLTFALEIYVDPSDILTYITEDKLVKLNIIPLKETQFQGKSYDINLMVIKKNYNFTIKPSLYKNKQPDRTLLKLICVEREPFSILFSSVNKIYFDKNVGEICRDLVTSFSPNAKITIDENNLNITKLSQVLIPPTTLYKAILYLDYFFGLYSGPLNVSCTSKREIIINNLSKQLEKSYIFTIRQLSSASNNDDIFFSKSNDDKDTYTTSIISTSDSSGSKFANLSKNITYIVKPSNTLFKNIELNLETIAKNYGACYKNSTFNLDSILDERKRFIYSNIGYQDTNQFAVSSISKDLIEIASLNIVLERNLINLDNLLNCGSAVKFETGITEFISLNGKYLLKSSNILFSKKVDWRAQASIVLIRTNKQI